MDEVMDHFGIGFLELLGGIGIIGVISTFFIRNGIINDMICEYFQRLCG